MSERVNIWLLRITNAVLMADLTFIGYLVLTTGL